MNRRPTSLRIRTLVLTAIALAAVAGGCIQGHDPRNDTSRVDPQQRDAIAISVNDAAR